jgi:hypothetical protein
MKREFVGELRARRRHRKNVYFQVPFTTPDDMPGLPTYGKREHG